MAPLPKWPAKSQTLQDASSQRIDSAAGKLQPVPAASPPERQRSVARKLGPISCARRHQTLAVIAIRKPDNQAVIPVPGIRATVEHAAHANGYADLRRLIAACRQCLFNVTVQAPIYPTSFRRQCRHCRYRYSVAIAGTMPRPKSTLQVQWRYNGDIEDTVSA